MAMDMNLAFKINAGVSGQQAIDKFKDSLSAVERVSLSLDRNVTSLAKNLAGAFIGFQAVQGLASFTKSAIDSADALLDMSDRTGIAVEELSKLEYAAKLNDTSLEAVQRGFQQIAMKATEAATGNKTLAETFRALGVNIKDANGNLRSGQDLFEDIADVVAGIENPTLQAGVAVEVFGKSGLELLPLLKNLRESKAEAEALGIVVGADFAKKAGQFNDSLDRMQFAARGLVITIGNAVIPTITELLNEFTRGMAISGGFWESLRLFGTINPFKSLDENIKGTTAEIEKLQKEIARLEAAPSRDRRADAQVQGRLRGLREDLADEQKRLEFLRFQSGQANPPATPTAGTGGSDRDAEVQALLKRLEAARGAAKAEGEAKKEAEAAARARDQAAEAAFKDLENADKTVDAFIRGNRELLERKKLEMDLRGLSEADKAVREQIFELDKRRAAALRDLQKIEDPAVRTEAIKATNQAYEEQRGQIEQVTRAQIESNNTFEAGAREAFRSYVENARNAANIAGQVFNSVTRSMEDAFVQFTLTGKLSFREFASSVVADLARIAARRAVAGIAENIFSSVVGSIATSFTYGTNVGSQQTAMLAAQDAGFRATGGPVSAGSPYVVGERGPELFVPMQSGRVVPNGSFGGGDSVTVNVNVESGQATSDGEGRAGKLGNAIASVVRDELIKQKRPGGLLAA